MKYFIHISANIVKEIQGLKKKQTKKQTPNQKNPHPTPNQTKENKKKQTKKTQEPPQHNTHPTPSSLGVVHIVQVKPFNTLNYYPY